LDDLYDDCLKTWMFTYYCMHSKHSITAAASVWWEEGSVLFYMLYNELLCIKQTGVLWETV
jgi:hypothetical protein